METKEATTSKNSKRKIITLVIGIFIIILAAIGIYLNVTKPSASDLLSTSSQTNIKSARSTIIIKSKKENVTQNLEFNSDISHMSITSSPANVQDQDLWASDKKVYTKLNKKWYYVDIAENQVYKMFFSTMFTSSKKLFSRHNFSNFDASALNQMHVKLDGLTDYKISYSGNNSSVIKSILKSSQLSNSQATPIANQIKNISFNITTDRNKNLRDVQYTLVYKDSLGSISVHLSNINGIKDLAIPQSVTSKAKETSLENIQK